MLSRRYSHSHELVGCIQKGEMAHRTIVSASKVIPRSTEIRRTTIFQFWLWISDGLPPHRRQFCAEIMTHQSPNAGKPLSNLRARVSRKGYKIRSCALPLTLGTTIAITLLSGCAGQPPGANFPRQSSVALIHPETTFLGEKFAQAARDHGGNSGFRILNVGVDGFLTRVQMIDAAERSLDLQYFIFRGDETGRLITAALLRAADRGVHVRVLIDDGDTVPGDEQILALDGHPSVEIRVFNPFAYRGHAKLLRGMEFMLNMRRLDYRMHNKLLVADNAVALIGGRNIGNQYFQMDPESQFADDDVFSVGPVVQQLSATFDEFWNSTHSIPAAALGGGKHRGRSAEKHRRLAQGSKPMLALDSPGIDYAAMVRTDEPYAGMISGLLPLVWANAEVACDSPDKKNVENGVSSGRLMSEPVAKAAAQVHTELLMVTPYFVPAGDEMHLLDTLLRNNVRVAILTNSLSQRRAYSRRPAILTIDCRYWMTARTCTKCAPCWVADGVADKPPVFRGSAITGCTPSSSSSTGKGYSSVP